MFYILILFCLTLNTSSHIIYLKTCRSPNICTKIKNCDRLAIVTKLSYCGFSKNSFKVCCPELNTTSTTSTSAPRVIRRNDDITGHKNFRFLPLDKCGKVSSQLRIISGSSTGPEEFPWMALIAYKAGNSSQLIDFKCGGTLITKNYVLTAAHCIDNATVLGVRLGEYDLNSDVDCNPNNHVCKAPVQDLSIDKIVIHPFYNPDSFANDLALIKLGKPANFTDGNVQPICLPFDELLNTSLEGMNLTVAGWGKTDQGENSSILRKVTVPVLPFSTCQALYLSMKPITEKQICAGGEGGRDSCAGDSGGPLKTVHYINSSPRYVQYGIVSFGPSKCGLSTRPGVYTNVQKYMKWILDNLSE